MMMISSSEIGSKTQRSNSEERRKIKNFRRHSDLVRWRLSFRRSHLSQSKHNNLKNHQAKKVRRIKRRSVMSLLKRKRKKSLKSLTRVTNLSKMIMGIPLKRQKRLQRRNKLREQISLL